jgi:hypothetical protein
MKQTEIEIVGRVFVVMSGKRKCLIGDGIFTPTQAANHAATLCYPNGKDSEHDEGTLNPSRPSC